MAGYAGSMLGGGNSGGNIPRGPQVSLSLKDLTQIECESCKKNVFSEGLMLFTVSAILTGTGKEGMMPVPAFYCVNCGTVVEKFLPDEVKNKKVIL
jgi:hypothetical protein